VSAPISGGVDLSALKARAESAARPQPSVRRGVGQRERDRARRGVPEAVEVDHHALPIDAELAHCVVDDADVRLVRHVDVHVLHTPVALLQHLLRR